MTAASDKKLPPLPAERPGESAPYAAGRSNTFGAGKADETIALRQGIDSRIAYSGEIGISESQGPAEALRESEARLRALLSSLDDLVFELDRHGTYLGVWTTSEALLAAPRHELLGRNIREAIGDRLSDELLQVIGRVLDTNTPEIWEYSMSVPAGVRWFQGRLAPIADSGGYEGRICLLVRDVTDQKAAEREITRLLYREQLLSRLSEAVPVGLFEIDAGGRVTFTNERLHKIVGHPPAVTIEEQMAPVVPEDREVLRAAVASVLAEQPLDDIEIRLSLDTVDDPPGNRSNSERVCLLSLRALTDATGAVTGAVGCLTDVTDPVQLRHELELRASVDELTSCLNRSAALGLLARTLAAPDPNGQGTALVFIDLDRFKSVNDLFGHAAGDHLLVAVADLLRGAIRDCDVIGRFGGDEFVVICPRVEGTEQAVTIAERIEAALNTTVDVGPAIIELRTSVGVTWSAQQGDPDAIIAEADSAMYQSKRVGKKGVSLFMPAPTRDS